MARKKFNEIEYWVMQEENILVKKFKYEGFAKNFVKKLEDEQGVTGLTIKKFNVVTQQQGE